MKRLIVSLLILCAMPSQANELKKMEKVIGEYYAYRADCPTPGTVTTQSLYLAINGGRDYNKIYPPLLPDDTELLVNIEVCGIKAHDYVWMRKMREYYRIIYYSPYDQIQKEFRGL